MEETINNSRDCLFGNEGKINNFSRKDFKKVLRMASQNNFFNFDGKIYKQTDGLAMGSSLRPSLANAFLCFHKQIWLNDCPEEFKPVYYRRYVDGIFALFRLHDHLEKLFKFETLNLPMRKKVTIHCLFWIFWYQDQKMVLKHVYHKPTFSGVYSNLNSFNYNQYKIGLIFTLLFRTFSITFEFSKFHTVVNHFKKACLSHQAGWQLH